LEGADHHILAAFLAPPRFVEHAERLAHACGITKKYLEPSSRGWR
jgi:hypothetical protein